MFEEDHQLQDKFIYRDFKRKIIVEDINSLNGYSSLSRRKHEQEHYIHPKTQNKS